MTLLAAPAWSALLRLWKPLAGAAVLGIVLWQVHAYGQRKADAREAEIRALWQDERQRWEALNARIEADARAWEQAQIEHNAKVMHDYETQLAAATASRDEYFGLLQRARGEIHRLAALEAGREPGAADAREAAGYARLDRLSAAAFAECRANTEQLDALILQLTPQVEPLF